MEIIKKTFNHINMAGSSYEVGQYQAKLIKNIPGWVRFAVSKTPKLTINEFEDAKCLFESVCPGLNEELRGMADYLDVPARRISFYRHTFLRPHCSTFCVLREKSKDGHIYVCRSYEFNYKMDDYRLCSTKISGKYRHTGFSSMLFGRNEGINEKGLCVTMSSAGFPVGNMKWFRSPAIKGAHFWLLVRGILENCKDVADAVKFVESVPVAFNVNLLLTDKNGNACLLETFNGRKAVKKPEKNLFLGSTNHTIIQKLKKYSDRPMRHSTVRYELMKDLFKSKKKLEFSDLRDICSKKYPEGMSALYYSKFFGTIYSLIFDLTANIMYVCFGPPSDNKWLSVNPFKIEKKSYNCRFHNEKPPAGFFQKV